MAHRPRAGARHQLVPVVFRPARIQQRAADREVFLLRRRGERQPQVKAIRQREFFLQRVAFIHVVLPFGEALAHDVAAVARRVNHDVRRARLEAALQNRLERRVFRAGIVERQIVHKHDEFPRLLAQDGENRRQIRQLRQRHLDDAQPLQPKAAQQRLDRRGFARPLVAVEQDVAGLPPVEQPARVFHQRAALSLVEHHVLQPDRVRLADAAQPERIFFALADPRTARTAGKQPRALLSEKRRRHGHALPAQHHFG